MARIGSVRFQGVTGSLILITFPRQRRRERKREKETRDGVVVGDIKHPSSHLTKLQFSGFGV